MRFMISMSFGLCVAVLMQFISNFVVGIFTVDTMVIPWEASIFEVTYGIA